MNRLVAVVAAFVCGVLPLAAAAVDRTLGAGVAKPAAGGRAWSAADRATLGRNLDALLDTAAEVRAAHVGLIVEDAGDGAPLYERRADETFVPASTQKLIAGSVALDLLGPAYRLRTSASVDAAGTLIVRGGGDPLLSWSDLGDLVARVASLNLLPAIRDVAVDGTRYDDGPYPPGWMVDDLPYDYAAPVGAVAFERNVVHLVVSAPALPGGVATIGVTPALRDVVGMCLAGCGPTLDVVVTPRLRTVAAGAATAIDVARTPENAIELRGTVAAGASPEPVDVAVPDGGVYLRRALVQRLTDAGATIAPPAAPERMLRTYDVGRERTPLPPIWTHDSEPLAELLADCWQPSDNLLAELLLREVGTVAGGMPGSTAKGIAQEQRWLRGIGVDPDRLALSDGSGLSAYDRLSPRALAAVLRHDWASPHRDVVLDALPIAGVRGTLASSFAGTPAERRVFAKTGSVSHARALAGYVATRRRGALVFAFLVDDAVGVTSASLDALRARVLSRLVDA